MKVMVTGAAGRLGRWVVDDFLAQGWQVIAVDRVPIPAVDAATRSGAEFHLAGLKDVASLAELIQGCQAVVHLAAIPTPTLGSREEVFVNNTQSTFAVLEAASQVGVRKAVLASSTSAYGMAFADPPFAPMYVPIDEDHPLIASDSYALSKQVNECTAAMYQRATGMSVIALRFHWIARPGEGPQRAASAESATEFQIRRQWGYVDARDAAKACRLAVLAEGIGFEAINIVAPDVLSELPINVLLDRHLPDVRRVRPLSGTDAAFTIDKARRMLGWEPEHNWRAHE
jgi:nucleoside-diphosphate-sugar epimerase